MKNLILVLMLIYSSLAFGETHICQIQRFSTLSSTHYRCDYKCGNGQSIMLVNTGFCTPSVYVDCWDGICTVK